MDVVHNHYSLLITPRREIPLKCDTMEINPSIPQETTQWHFCVIITDPKP